MASLFREYICLVPMRQEQEPLVDVSDMFTYMFPTEHLANAKLVASNSYKVHMTNQIQAFAELSKNPVYWNFISTKNRVAYMPTHMDIENLIQQGIPSNLRRMVWNALAGINSISREVTTKYHAFKGTAITEDDARTIEVDVPRAFSISDPSFETKLSNILNAYTHYNPNVGYCQGMNFIAAVLLLFMEDDHAFRMLVYIIEELLPNFHSIGTPGYLEAREIFKVLLATELPELNTHFQSIGFDVSWCTSSWFMGLFVHEMPHVATFMIWDNVMLRGTNAIFEAGLAILRMLQRELLQIDGFDIMKDYMDNCLSKLYNPLKLRKHWENLPFEKVKSARVTIQRSASMLRLATAATTMYFVGVPFENCELQGLWLQYASASPVLACRDTGLGLRLFTRLIEGTLRDWIVDTEITNRLFRLLDKTQVGIVTFPAVACFLYCLTRGSFAEFADFTIQLFDFSGKGWLDEEDLLRMLRSLFSVFDTDPKFLTNTEAMTAELFNMPNVKATGKITTDNMKDVALQLKEITAKFKDRNPRVNYNVRKTYFYWLFHSVNRGRLESIQISYNLQRAEAPTVGFSISVGVAEDTVTNTR